jgi:hypothetical protein
MSEAVASDVLDDDALLARIREVWEASDPAPVERIAAAVREAVAANA